MKWKWNIFFLTFVLCQNILAQNKDVIEINFQPVFGNQKIQNEKDVFVLDNGDSLHISLLKFYISNIELLQNGNSIWQEKKSFHFVDLDKKQSLHLQLKTPTGLTFNQIKFNLGIDSVTNVSGAMSGDLDPINGMYWTWQSGYINFKIEGTDQRSTAVHHSFGYHLGGYEYPNQTIQTIVLNVKSQKELNIKVDAKQFLDGINIAEQAHIMTPGADAVQLSKKVATIFSIEKE